MMRKKKETKKSRFWLSKQHLPASRVSPIREQARQSERDRKKERVKCMGGHSFFVRPGHGAHSLADKCRGGPAEQHWRLCPWALPGRRNFIYTYSESLEPGPFAVYELPTRVPVVAAHFSLLSPSASRWPGKKGTHVRGAVIIGPLVPTARALLCMHYYAYCACANSFAYKVSWLAPFSAAMTMQVYMCVSTQCYQWSI